MARYGRMAEARAGQRTGSDVWMIPHRDYLLQTCC
jgi:hypothetical protein